VKALCTRAVSLAVAAVLTGCAIAPMGSPIPSVQNIGKARAAGMAPIALGEFRLAAGKPVALDQSISIRTNTIHSPYGSSFSSYLKETIATDLRAAGLLDEAAPIVLSGQLVDSQIDVPAGTARAVLAAVFTVTRGGAPVYERELRVQDVWQASFIGAEAVPMGMNHYGQLYRRLTGELLDDPLFRAAVKAAPPL
jgi:hypothetical protein